MPVRKHVHVCKQLEVMFQRLNVNPWTQGRSSLAPSFNKPHRVHCNSASFPWTIYITSLFFSFPVTCCFFFLSVNYHWRKQPPVCGELRLAMCFLKWKAEGCGNPHTAPVNQLLPLLLRSLRHSQTSCRLETVSLGAHRAYPVTVTSDSAKLSVSRSNLWPLTFCFE